MGRSNSQRRQRLMPGGVPRYIRVYDNGGGAKRFCRKCLVFSDEELCCDQRTDKAGPGTADRYTVVYTGNYRGRNGTARYRGMSENPIHPLGEGIWGESDIPLDVDEHGFAPKMGSLAPFGVGNRRVKFDLLPLGCQLVVTSDYCDLWDLQQHRNFKINND